MHPYCTGRIEPNEWRLCHVAASRCSGEGIPPTRTGVGLVEALYQHQVMFLRVNAARAFSAVNPCTRLPC